MKRIRHWCVLLPAFCLCVPGFLVADTIVSVQSGNWGSASTWVGGMVPTKYDAVNILSGDTIVVESSGKSCSHLIVESGGVLYTNNSSTSSNPRYIYIYGDIACHGQIGNGTTYDLIGFNVEGDSCTISGNGSFDAARIRKYQNESDTTTLIINRLITLRIGGTAIYNNRSGTVFRVEISALDTLNVAGDGITAGNVAMDGINGAASSTGGGSITVKGALLVSGILYLTNSNSANPVAVTIAPGGVLETASISCPNSGNSGHTFTIENGGTLNLTSADWGEIGFTNNTYSFQPGSTVKYSGDTAQTVGNPTGYHHLVISGSGTKTIGTAMNVNGDLVIEQGSALRVLAGLAVTVSGTSSFSGTGCLVLRSPADSGSTASFICNGSITGSGTAVVERFIKKYQSLDDSRYHMLSSPVTDQQIQPLFVGDPPEAGCDFYRWGEQEGVWINSKEESGGWNASFQEGDNRNFIPGSGYLVAYPEDELKTFSGPLNNTDLSPAITYTEGDYSGFNLVGNPFPSALHAEIDNWVKSNVDHAVWVWDGEAGNYKSWNGFAGTLNDGVIPAMQGFFVHANGPSPSLTIPASSRVHTSHPFYKVDLPSTLEVSLFQQHQHDGIVLSVNGLSQPGYDPLEDVLKMFGAADAPQLFWIEEDVYLSVNVRPVESSGVVLPIGFIAGTQGEYLFRFAGQESFPAGEDLLFEDHLENRQINLRNTFEYPFQASAGYDPGRFSLRLGNPAGKEEGVPQAEIFITSAKNRITVHGLDPLWHSMPLCLFDLQGKLVFTASVCASEPTVLISLQEGLYIARMIFSNRSMSEKIYLEQAEE